MIQHNISLSRLNTFHLPSVAERYLALTDLSQLDGPEFRQAPQLVLGGGSNMVLLEQVPGLTVHVQLGGVEILGGAAGAAKGSKSRLISLSKANSQAAVGREYSSDGEAVFLRVGAGVDWNQFVRYTLDRGWCGLENLILIPGTVGAAPVQNIGAYGAEVAECITAVHVWEYGVGARTLLPEDCAFGYRDSRFKREPGRFLITAVDFRLNDQQELKTGYGAIQAELAHLSIDAPSPADVALAVTNIRRSKLPDWFFLGNSGSFFKNPVVSIATHHRLLAAFEDIPSYPIDEGHVKLPAGWLIDRAGLKGARHGDVGTYAKQALVLVNHGAASGQDIIAFSKFIQDEVQAKFGVELEREVQLIGNS
ncbi:UDP-N-acetylmuramate dehydrogenase [Neolewinella persica]|uniref:UDP-N-acetylmuramate dehydrogenase n=1 Tax=Neolewinella persica TaxID=70998 RepID=UPI0003A9003D|nr:UDP-N-acetylmuramate dehydrogenase [Neolewinella persica]